MIKRRITIRQATVSDADGIAEVKHLVWPDEEVKMSQIRQAIAHEQHVTHVAVSGPAIIGFVDGFLTRHPSSCLRWEVDVLAMHPAYRGRHYGTKLVEQTTLAGYQRGAQVVRGLIRVKNIASQQTFVRCGYRRSSDVRTLYVASSAFQQSAMPLRNRGTRLR